MTPRRRFTRRGLIGAGAAGVLLGGSAGPAAAAVPGPPRRGERRNALLIVSSNTRSDFVGAYDHSVELAKTPNLDALADASLRFRHAVPEAMPGVPARRALLTGMRSYPFRDWRRTSGLPAEPGWNPIADHRQPIVTDVMRDAGVTTAYATDNPFLAGPHFANFRGTLDVFRGRLSQASWREYNEPARDDASSGEVERYLPPKLAGTDEERRLRRYVGYNRRTRRREEDYSAARVVDDGIGLLRELRGKQPFFLGVDLFDPHEPFDPPRRYLERFGSGAGGIEPIQPFETPSGRVAELELDEATVRRARELYAAELTFVDAWVGRLLGALEDYGLADDTLVVYLSDHGVSLGERGVMGRDPERSYEEVYRVPYMVRHPDGGRAGDESDWFASTHDVAPTLLSYMGLTAPGRMTGEDLTVLFDDEEDPPARRWFTTCHSRTVLVGDEDWLLVGRDQGAQKLLYETEEDTEQEQDVIRKRPDLERRLWRAAIVAAGGTLPMFDADSAVRPRPEVDADSADDTDRDGEPDTSEDQDLEDRFQQQEQRQDAQTQGVPGLGAQPGLMLACAACGALLLAASRESALHEAERHYGQEHPELAETTAREDMVSAEGRPDEPVGR
jgi:arylsulfatase A-like enzyme